MASHTTDKALVDGLRAGRRDAFERLYKEYHPAIYNLCARVLGDREEAKDVTQDVFIKAFNQLPAPGAEDLRLRPWLYRVATNACFNHLRSRKGLSGGDGAVLDEMPAHVDTFEQAETVALVEASLGQLSDRYRTALVLKDLHGLPPAEIASAMEISRPTADVLVHRARASFKVAFAKLAGDGAPAPASLGMVLAPLAVPAALKAVPALLAHAATGAAATAAHSAAAGTAHAAGSGLLSKFGAVLTSKVAIGAAAATLIVAGGAAELVTRAHNHNVADAATGSASPLSTVKSTFASQPLGHWHNRYGCGTWNDQRGWRQMKSWSWHMNKGYTWSGGSWKAPRSSGSWSGSGGSSGGGWSSGSSGTWSGSGSGSSSGSSGSWSGSGSSGGSWSGSGSSSMGGSGW